MMPKSQKPKLVSRTVRMTREFDLAIRKIAQSKNMTISQYIHGIVERSVNRQLAAMADKPK